MDPDQELKDVTTMLDEAIGWAEDTCMVISECYSNAADEWSNDVALNAWSAIGNALDLLREAQQLMLPAVAEAEREYWDQDKS